MGFDAGLNLLDKKILTLSKAISKGVERGIQAGK